MFGISHYSILKKLLTNKGIEFDEFKEAGMLVIRIIKGSYIGLLLFNDKEEFENIEFDSKE